MQNQMKSQPPLFALVPVPYEALVDAGIEIGDPLQFTVEKGIPAMSIPRALTKPLMKWSPDGTTQRTGRPKLRRWSRTTTTASPFSMTPALLMSIRDSE